MVFTTGAFFDISCGSLNAILGLRLAFGFKLFVFSCYYSVFYLSLNALILQILRYYYTYITYGN